VANQIMADDPPEVWQTAQRLIKDGYERHDILHMLASVVSKQTYSILNDQQPLDADEYIQALDALPDSWHALAEDHIQLPDGTTLTHRLTAEEAAASQLPFEPDFEPVQELLPGEWEFQISDGRALFAGPSGWLDDITTGQLVGLRVSGTGIEVVPVDTTADPADLRGAWLDAFRELNDNSDLPVPLGDLIAVMVQSVTDAAALVLPPISDLLDAYDFDVRDGHVAPKGTDWDSFARAKMYARVANRYGLGLKGGEALIGMSELHRLNLEGKPTPEDWEEADGLAELLADSDFGEAFVTATLTFSSPADIDGFVQQVEQRAPRRDRGGLRWVRAHALAAGGDHDQAEALIHSALEAQPDHLDALADAAWYASDRGDARKAMDFLRRLWELTGDDKTDERASLLDRYARPTAAPAGRNDPCPCGSGKKYKNCCLNRIGLAPLPDRIRWMWEKLDWWMTEHDFHDWTDELVDELGGDSSHELIAKSLIVFADGIIDEFVEDRGSLVPDDERRLFEQWMECGPSVHEVVAVDRGEGATLRNLVTDDEVDIRERIGSTQMKPGDLMLATVVPDGEGHQIVGGIMPIRLRMRDQLLELLKEEATSDTIVEFLAAAYAPPTMTTTEGEPMVFCEARYGIVDPAQLAALDDVLQRDDDQRWNDMAEVNGQNVVRGTVTTEGTELVVSANSQARFDRLRQTVESAVPSLKSLSTLTTPFSDLARSTRNTGDSPSEPMDEKTAKILDEVVRSHERRWIDQAIPALDGRTPRQAAADPAGRKDLEALLHDFEKHDPGPGAATFDTSRLRELLGLDESRP
jgi:tetratricopeptide (TPR) repeat protein